MKDILDKAVEGGLDLFVSLGIHPESLLAEEYKNNRDRFWNSMEAIFAVQGINDIIFSHDFLRAFFGEELISYKNGKWDKANSGEAFMSNNPFVLFSWQYHAQKLVLAEDRLAYLKQFINK